ncbi:MAG: PleD family two-component system response regulator [Microcystaceae cyanobacterium]
MSTILVADDSKTQREYMSELLTKCGFKVILATDGKEAVDKISHARFDLIILDIVMPEMNGFQVCRKIKNDPDTKHIPVILCSTKDTPADHYWGLKQGADAYVVKSFEPHELLATIKQIFKGI